MPAAEYLPEGEEPKSFSMMFAPAGYSYKEMSLIGAEVKDKVDLAVQQKPEDYIPRTRDDSGAALLPPLYWFGFRVVAE